MGSSLLKGRKTSLIKVWPRVRDALMTASQAYASANCGFFADDLECLTWSSGGMMGMGRI